MNEQRRYLRDQYDELAASGQDTQRDFVRSLSHVAQFLQHVWQQEPRFEGLDFNDDQALLCFQALRHLKHNITIAPLARFYDSARRGENGIKIARTEELAAAIRATTAFTMLWRSAKGGTENIDAQYRDFMKSPTTITRPDGTTRTIEAFCRRASQEALTIEDYKERLRSALKKEYPTRDDWVRVASRTPIYKHSAAVARFMLLCASHDSVPDAEHFGLVKRGVLGVAPLLTSQVWNDASYLTVEHVAPQTRGQGAWDASFDDDPDAMNRLGNLTLLPQVENSLLGNKPWEQKVFLYRMLSAETHDQRIRRSKASTVSSGRNAPFS